MVACDIFCKTTWQMIMIIIHTFSIFAPVLLQRIEDCLEVCLVHVTVVAWIRRIAIFKLSQQKRHKQVDGQVLSISANKQRNPLQSRASIIAWTPLFHNMWRISSSILCGKASHVQISAAREETSFNMALGEIFS